MALLEPNIKYELCVTVCDPTVQRMKKITQRSDCSSITASPEGLSQPRALSVGDITRSITEAENSGFYLGYQWKRKKPVWVRNWFQARQFSWGNRKTVARRHRLHESKWVIHFSQSLCRVAPQFSLLSQVLYIFPFLFYRIRDAEEKRNMDIGLAPRSSSWPEYRVSNRIASKVPWEP